MMNMIKHNLWYVMWRGTKRFRNFLYKVFKIDFAEYYEKNKTLKWRVYRASQKITLYCNIQYTKTY